MTRLFLALVFTAGLAGPDLAARAQDKPPVLELPIACEPGRTCAVQSYVDHDPGPGARDYRCSSRTYDKHSGIDIRIPDYAAMRAGVPVLAAAPGRVRAVRDGMADLSIRDRVGGTNFMDCGNTVIIDHAGGWATQYCHMRQNSLRVKAGDMLKAGDVIGLVGLTGLTEFPHVHMTLYHGREIVDPFAYGAPPGACSGGQNLWSPAAAAKLAYKQREVLNAGFASNPVEMDALEAGGLPRPTRASPALVAYIRAIGLKAGDVQTLEVRGPDNAVMAKSAPAALPRDQAQRLIYVGAKSPPGGLKAGVYHADYTVRRDGMLLLERRFELKL